jgi:hypothetical protein
MLLLAFKWITPPVDLAKIPHRRFRGTTLLNKTGAAGLRALTLLAPIAMASTWTSKK